MLNLKTRTNLQELLLNQCVSSFSIDDSKDAHGGIHTTVRIHTFPGTLICDVMDPIAAIFKNGIFAKSNVIKHAPANFVSTDFIHTECSVTIFTDLEKSPAVTEDLEKIELLNDSTITWTLGANMRHEG